MLISVQSKEKKGYSCLPCVPTTNCSLLVQISDSKSPVRHLETIFFEQAMDQECLHRYELSMAGMLTNV